MSNAYYSNILAAPIITIASRVYSDHSLIGYVTTSIKIEQLQKMIETFNQGTSYAYLLDSNGSVIAHIDRNKSQELYNYKNLTKTVLTADKDGNLLRQKNGTFITSKQDISLSPSMKDIIDKVSGGETGIGEYTTTDGEKFICSYRPVYFPGLNEHWSLLVVRRYSSIMEFMDNVIRDSFIIALASFLIAIYLIILFSRRLLNPLFEILTATNEVKNGNLTVKLPITRHDEIGSLADNFNKMVAALLAYRQKQDENEKHIKNMAYHDALTSLPNRIKFKEYLEEIIQTDQQKGQHYAILFIDLDEFKLINDNFGHSIGDNLLINVSQRIVASTDKNSFICRFGGDEFIIIIPITESDTLTDKINYIHSFICGEYKIANNIFHLSASIGVALYPDNGNTQEELLQKADSALHSAKNSGRNNWCFFHHSMLSNSYEQIILTDALRNAIANNELFLVYQPQFNIDGTQVVGFETLVRWKQTNGEMISPGKFIPLAEQSGLILPIGQWILQQSCKFLKRTNDLGYENIKISVNLSPVQLVDNNIIDSISAVIEETGIRHSQLTIEITETAAIKSLDDSIAKLTQLREKGIRVALDDFGTGYSSLTYLRTLPVNFIKIDKSFIDKISLDSTQSQLVGCIIDMAHTLGTTVIAEGVEDFDQLKELFEYGCDYIQGYVYGKPLSEADALKVLEEFAQIQ